MKVLLAKIMKYTGMLWLFNLGMRDRITVLTYHEIKKEPFEKQMDLIKGRVVKDLSDPHKKRAFMITFDDGTYDTYEKAYPILERLGLPFAVFLTTDYVDHDKTPWWKRVELSMNDEGHSRDEISKEIERLKTLPNAKRLKEMEKYPAEHKGRNFISWKEARMMQPLATFGGHTRTHPILTNCEESEIVDEVVSCREIIRKETGQKAECFAYPNGDYDKKVLSAVKDAGFRYAFTTRSGHFRKATRRLEIPRISINIDDDLDVFRLKTGRLWSWLR